MPSVFRTLVITSGARLYSLGASLLFIVICARLLGPAGQGVVAAATGWVILFGTLGHLSLGQVTLYKAAHDKNNNWFNHTFGTLICIAIVISILGWGVALALWITTSAHIFTNLPPLPLSLAFIALPFYIWEAYSSGLLIALNKLAVYNRAQIIGKTLSIPIAIILIHYLQMGEAGAVIAMVTAQAITALYGISLLIRASTTKLKADIRTAKALIISGVKLHMNAVGAYLLSSINILVLQHYSGAAETGQYHFANQLMLGVYAIPTAAQLVLSSRLTSLGPTQLWRVQKTTIGLTLIIVLVVALLLAAVAKPLVLLTAGSAFLPAIDTLHILLLSSIPTSLSIVMATQWIGRGLFWQTSLLTFLSGATNLAFSMLIVPHHGAKGAAWATLLSSLLIPLTANIIMAIKAERELKASAKTSLKHGEHNAAT